MFFSTRRERYVFCLTAILAVLSATVGLVGIPGGPPPARAGVVGCDPFTCFAPNCAAPWCNTCSWCITETRPPGGRSHFAEPEEPDWVWGGYKKEINCSRGSLENFCVRVHIVKGETDGVLLDSRNNETGYFSDGIQLNPGDTKLFPDRNPNGLLGATVSASQIKYTSGGMPYIEVCFDFSTREFRDECPPADETIQLTLFDRDALDLSDYFGNKYFLELTFDNKSPSYKPAAPVRVAEGSESLTIAGRITTFVADQGQVTLFGGTLTRYYEGVVQEILQIENGVFSIAVPTTGVSLWEIINTDGGTTVLRFEVVNGYLQVTEDNLEQRSVPYFLTQDGTYRLDYWTYLTQVYICGPADDNAPLMSPLYWSK